MKSAEEFVEEIPRLKYFPRIVAGLALLVLICVLAPWIPFLVLHALYAILNAAEPFIAFFGACAWQ